MYETEKEFEMYSQPNPGRVADELLRNIVEKISLTPTLHRRATERYGALAAHLSEEGTAFSDSFIEIYPQGSMALGTAIRPHAGEDFDLDFIVLLSAKLRAAEQPESVMSEILGRIRECGPYSKIASITKRVIRLDYKDEFHMDLLVATPTADPDSGLLSIPKTDRTEWEEKPDPRRYADWYATRCLQLDARLLEAAVTDVPNLIGVADRPIPTLVVQLLKAARNEQYERSQTSPSSILLTTLVATHFCWSESLSLAAANTARTIADRIVSKNFSLKVINPGDPRGMDDLAEGMTEDEQKELAKFLLRFAEAIECLLRVDGRDRRFDALSTILGPVLANCAFADRDNQVEVARAAGSLGIAGGGLSLSASPRHTPVPKNTFHGV